MKKVLLIALVVVTTVLSGCQVNPPAASADGGPSAPEPSATASAGSVAPSPTMAASAAPSAAPTQKPTPSPTPSGSIPSIFWKRLDGSTATIPISEALYERFSGSKNAASQIIVHNKTFEAYERLLNKPAELIFVTEPPESVLNEFRDAGVEIEVIPIVKDAFVLFVNTENPVTSLTQQQLRDIYTGDVTSWSEVGGADRDIIPYQRNESSGSQVLFRSLLMKDVQPIAAPYERISVEMGDIINAVSSYDNSSAAIGFSVYYYASAMYGNDSIRLLAVDGVAPNHQTIASGQYPLVSYYYAVLRKDTPEDAPARMLVDFILSDEGQRLMQDAGYVPLRPLEG